MNANSVVTVLPNTKAPARCSRATHSASRARPCAGIDRRAHLRRQVRGRDDVLDADADAARADRCARPRRAAASACARGSDRARDRDAPTPGRRVGRRDAREQRPRAAPRSSISPARDRVRRGVCSVSACNGPLIAAARSGLRARRAMRAALARQGRNSACRSFRKRRPSARRRRARRIALEQPASLGRVERACRRAPADSRCARRRARPARLRSAAARSA